MGFIVFSSCSQSGNSTPSAPGSSPLQDPGNGTPASQIYVYLSQSFVPANGLGTRTQANAACHGAQLVYAPATQCSHFMALVLYSAELNLSNLAVQQQVPQTAPVYLLDGSRQVGASFGALVSANPTFLLGDYGIPDRFFWSGYQQSTGALANNCGDWKNTGSSATVGSIQDNPAFSGWSNMSVQCSSSTQRLMCLCW